MSNIKTLEEVSMIYVSLVLKANNGNKTHAAKDLGVSVKSMFNYIKKFEKYGLKVFQPIVKGDGRKEKPTKHKEIDLSWMGMPTNEFRCKYRDKMINKNTL